MSYTLEAQDQMRLALLAQKLSNTGSSISVEGLPLYSNVGFTDAEQYVYSQMIPTLLSGITGHATITVEGMFTESYTTEVTADDSLHMIVNALLHRQSNANTRVRVQKYSSPQLLDRSEEIIRELVGQGKTIGGNGQVLLHLPQQADIALTTSQGKPTAAMVDASYQLSKADRGVDTSVIIHGVEYKGQQLRMIGILQAVQEGMIPFNSLYHVFVNPSQHITAVTHRTRNAHLSHV